MAGFLPGFGRGGITYVLESKLPVSFVGDLERSPAESESGLPTWLPGSAPESIVIGCDGGGLDLIGGGAVDMVLSECGFD